MQSYTQITLEAVRCPVPFERVSISLRSTCRLGELQRQETFHIKDLMQHGPKHNTAYELPRVLTFRCLLKRVKNHVVNMVFEHSFRSVMMIVHHEQVRMDTLVENEFLHKLRTYLHLEESTEYRNKLGRICVKIGMIQIPYKHHRKSTHVVIRLKDKKCGIFKNVSMTFMDLNSLDAFETEDSVLYKLQQQLMYICDPSTAKNGKLTFTFYDSTQFDGTNSLDIVGGKGQKYQYKSNFSVLRLLQNPDFLKWETYEGIAKPFIKRDKTILFEVVPFNNLYDILQPDTLTISIMNNEGFNTSRQTYSVAWTELKTTRHLKQVIVLLPFPLAFFSDFSEKQSLVIALTQGKGRFKKRVHFTRYPANSLLDRASDFLLQSYKNLDHKAGFKQAIDIDEVKKPLSIPVSFFRKLGIEVLFFRKLEVYKEAKQVTVELLRNMGGCLKVLKTFHFYLRSITSWEYKDLIIFQMPYKLVFGKQPEKAQDPWIRITLLTAGHFFPIVLSQTMLSMTDFQNNISQFLLETYLQPQPNIDDDDDIRN